MKPINGNIIVRSVEEESLLEIPDEAKQKPEMGVVLFAGDSKILKDGDRVMFRKYSPDEIKVDDKTYLVIQESDILIIL